MRRAHSRTRGSVRVSVLAAAAAATWVASGGAALAWFTSSASGATEFATRDLLAPAALTAGGSCSTSPEAKLDWTVGSSWADGQEIWRSTTAGSDGVRVATALATATAYTDGALNVGTTYYYRVKSVKAGWVESSAEVSFVCA